MEKTFIVVPYDRLLRIQKRHSIIGEGGGRKTLSRAEVGQFSNKSWAFWHFRLNNLYVHYLPPIPQRILPFC